jgi:hypothetical protein
VHEGVSEGSEVLCLTSQSKDYKYIVRHEPFKAKSRSDALRNEGVISFLIYLATLLPSFIMC